MKNLVRLVVCFLVVSLSICIIGCHADASGDINISGQKTPNGIKCATAIEGLITENESGRPVENALVTLQTGGASTNKGTTRTDSKGLYRFSSIACGDQYDIIATKDHYSVGQASVVANGNGLLKGDLQMRPSCFTMVTNDLNFGYTKVDDSKIVKFVCEGSIDYSVSTDQPSWITVINPSGKLNSGQTATITVRIDRSRLPNAVNNGFVLVNSPRGEQTISVIAYK